MTNPLFDLTGHVAIVTGTSRGLGQYFARAAVSLSHKRLPGDGGRYGVTVNSPGQPDDLDSTVV